MGSLLVSLVVATLAVFLATFVDYKDKRRKLTNMKGGSLQSTLTRRVFDYWFEGGLPQTRALDPKFIKLWFGGGRLVDEEIKKRFTTDLDWLLQETFEAETSPSTTGTLASLTSDPNETLARIIALDQFSRNIYRDSPRMFSADTRALFLARQATGAGQHVLIPHPCMRIFLFMPFMHAEDLGAQDEGLALFREAWERESEDSPFKDILAIQLGYMTRHRDIIARFGRFPHRNSILGRPMRPEEEAFLASGGDTFDARANKPDMVP